MTRTVTGLFDTRAEAERAADDLRNELNLDPGRIRIHAPEHKKEGFLDWLARIWRPEADFLPPEDRSLFTEAVQRGGTVVSADVQEDLAVRAMDVIERHNPVDLDARADEWRRQGWTGFTAHDEEIGFATYGQDAVISRVKEGPRRSGPVPEGGLGRAESAVAQAARRDEARSRPRVRVYMWEASERMVDRDR